MESVTHFLSDTLSDSLLLLSECHDDDLIQRECVLYMYMYIVHVPASTTRKVSSSVDPLPLPESLPLKLPEVNFICTACGGELL